jgi:hypothetical protein
MMFAPDKREVSRRIWRRQRLNAVLQVAVLHAGVAQDDRDRSSLSLHGDDFLLHALRAVFGWWVYAVRWWVFALPGQDPFNGAPLVPGNPGNTGDPSPDLTQMGPTVVKVGVEVGVEVGRDERAPRSGRDRWPRCCCVASRRGRLITRKGRESMATATATPAGTDQEGPTPLHPFPQPKAAEERSPFLTPTFHPTAKRTDLDIIREVILAFFDKTLLGRGASLLDDSTTLRNGRVHVVRLAQ